MTTTLDLSLTSYLLDESYRTAFENPLEGTDHIYVTPVDGSLFVEFSQISGLKREALKVPPRKSKHFFISSYESLIELLHPFLIIKNVKKYTEEMRSYFSVLPENHSVTEWIDGAYHAGSIVLHDTGFMVSYRSGHNYSSYSWEKGMRIAEEGRTLLGVVATLGLSDVVEKCLNMLECK